jgi:hypothetical protein
MDDYEDIFLLTEAAIQAVVLPALGAFFAFGYEALFMVTGLLLIGASAGWVKYKYFPYRVTTYFNDQGSASRRVAE